jgi:hypothetical protein
MDGPEVLRRRAAHYRDLARYITDARARSGAIELARQCEQQAEELDAAQASRPQARPAGDSDGA